MENTLKCNSGASDLRKIIKTHGFVGDEDPQKVSTVNDILVSNKRNSNLKAPSNPYKVLKAVSIVVLCVVILAKSFSCFGSFRSSATGRLWKSPQISHQAQT